MRLVDLAISAALLLAGIAYFGRFVDYGISIADEGALLAQFARLAGGETPYVDFHIGYTPGVYYLNAWLLGHGGGSLIPVRWLLAVLHGTSLALLYALGRRATGARGLAAAAAAFYAASIPVHPGGFAASNVPYPVWYAVPLWTAGLLSLLGFGRRAAAGRDGRGWLLAAGLLAGAGFLFKPNVGLFQLAASSLLVLARIPRRAAGRVQGAVWALWWLGVLAGVAGVFAGATARELVLFALPALAAALLVLREASALAPARGAPRALPCALWIAAGFLAVNLPWMVHFYGLLGPQRFLQRALFFGAGFEHFYRITHPPVVLALAGTAALAAILVRAPRRLAARRRPPVALALLALAGLGALLVVGLRPRPVPEGLAWGIVRKLELRVFALALVAHWAGLALWLRGLARRSAPEPRFAHAVLCLGAIFLYLQIYPRADSMHWVTAAPVSTLLGFSLVGRIAARWSGALAGRVSPRLAAAALLAPLLAAGALRLALSLDALYDLRGGVPRPAPRVRLESERAPIWINAGDAGHYGDLSAVSHFLREHTEPGERIFTFPSLDLISFLSGRPNATRHAYFFPGWPGRDVEAEVVATLAARPPRFVVVAHWNMLFFANAGLYYYTLGDFLASHYRPYAHFGRYAVLAHRQTGPPGEGPAYRRPTLADVLEPAREARLRRELEADDAGRRLAAVRELGEMMPEDDYPPLTRRLADPDLRVRLAALRAIGHTRDPNVACALLEQVMAHGVPTGPAASAVRGLLDALAPGCVRPLLAASYARDPALGRIARRALMAIASDALLASFWPGAAPDEPRSLADLGLPRKSGARIAHWLEDSDADPRLRLFAVYASPVLDDAEALPRLLALAKEQSRSELGLRAMWALVRRGRAAEVLEPAKVAFQYDEVLAPRVLREALRASPRGDRTLAGILHDAAPGVVERAAWLAAGVGGPLSAKRLASLLDGPKRVRLAAAWALGNIGDASQRPLLERAAADGDVDVREMAGFALAELDRRLR